MTITPPNGQAWSRQPRPPPQADDAVDTELPSLLVASAYRIAARSAYAVGQDNALASAREWQKATTAARNIELLRWIQGRADAVRAAREIRDTVTAYRQHAGPTQRDAHQAVIRGSELAAEWDAVEPGVRRHLEAAARASAGDDLPPIHRIAPVDTTSTQRTSNCSATRTPSDPKHRSPRSRRR